MVANRLATTAGVSLPFSFDSIVYLTRPGDLTGNLLIKSYSVDVFRRVIRCCIVLQLNLRTLKSTKQQPVNRGKSRARFWNE